MKKEITLNKSILVPLISAVFTSYIIVLIVLHFGFFAEFADQGVHYFNPFLDGQLKYIGVEPESYFEKLRIYLSASTDVPIKYYIGIFVAVGSLIWLLKNYKISIK